MAERPFISVVVCTWNSGSRSRETLVSLRHQSLRRGAYEVIVVDNASDGKTARFLRAQCKTLKFRLVREECLGLCHARNRGVLEARGTYVYFIDDDAVAPAHLLETFHRAGKRIGPGLMGGPAHGLWEATPPRWLQTFHWRGFSLYSLGAKPRYLRQGEFFLGCNMAFRSDLFTEVGVFDPDLGRKGTSLAGDEERVLETRMMARGHKALYLPDAYVFHKVTGARMTKDYFLRRAEDNAVVKTALGEKDRVGGASGIALLARQTAFALARALKQMWITLELEFQLMAADRRGRGKSER